MSDVLASLGLSTEEREIYRILLVSGQLSGGEIRSITGLGTSAVNNALQSLEAKKLVRRVPGLQDRFAALLPVDTAVEKVQESLGTITTLGRSFQDDKDRTLSELKEESEKLLGNLEETLENVRNEITTQSEDTGRGLIESAQTTNQAANAKKQDYMDEIEQNKTDFDRRSMDLVQNHSGRIDAAKTTLNTKTSESIRSFLESTQILPPEISIDLKPAEDTAQEIKERLEIFKESQKGLITRQSKLSSSQIEEIGRTAEVNSNRLTQMAQELNDELISKMTETKGNLGNSLDQGRTVLNGVAIELESSSSKVAETIDQGINFLSTSKNSLQQNVNGGVSDFKNAIKSTFQTGRDHLSTIHSSGTGFVENANQIALDHFGMLENEFTTLIKQKEEEIKQSMEQEFTRLLNQAQQAIESLNSDLSDTLKQKIDSIKIKQIELRSQAIETINQMNTQKNQVLDSLEQQNVEELERIRNELISQLGNSFDSINSQMSELQQKISDMMFSAKSRLTQSENEITENKNQMGQSIDQFLQHLSRTLQEFHDSLKTEKEAFTNHLQEQGVQIEGQLNSLVAEIEQDLSNSMGDVDSSFLNLKHQISSKIAEANSNLNEQVVQLTETLSSHLENLKNEFIAITETEAVAQKNLVENFKSDLDGFSQRVKALSTTLAEEITNGSIQLTDLLLSKLNEHNELIKENGFTTVEKVKGVASGISEAHLVKSKDLLENYVGNFVSSSNTLVSSLQGLNESLIGFSRLIETTETPQIKTTTIVGRQAIVEYIRDMLGRIKSKATLLVPSIEMVDVERILQLPRTVQVTIVSYIDEVTHRDWIEKMHNAPANVTLRAIQKGGLGGTLPDFIGCEREGEEILLGTIDEGNNDYVAIASGSEYFVKILGNIVISDYARGKSRQLPK